MSAPYYQRGGITIWHGDCRDVCEDLPERSVDLLLTDPPYRMAVQTAAIATGVRANVAGDGVRAGMRIVRGMLSAIRPSLADDAHSLCFCAFNSFPDFVDTLAVHVPMKSALVWYKAQGGTGDCELEYARDYELIIFGALGRRPLAGRRDGAVITGHKPPRHTDRVHPTEKPVSLLRYLIGKSCPPGGLVADPFMGGGSTLVACAEMGVRGVGVEVEERYCEAAARRVDAALDQGAIFARPLASDATQGVVL